MQNSTSKYNNSNSLPVFTPPIRGKNRKTEHYAVKLKFATNDFLDNTIAKVVSFILSVDIKEGDN
ncbi:hypothetical protein KKA15_04430 [Patescibacteria group bacterium]|nr:hypothetical protein [Patescibacteria group bacterium]